MRRRRTPAATGWAYLDRPPFGPGTIVAMAHRGGAKHPENLGVENTVAAFRRAVALGYHYLETDVHATSDGVLVAFHDEGLDRVTDRSGALATMTHAEVADFRVGGREPVPTLAEVVDALPDHVRFNIDIKADGAVGPLAAFITERALADRVLVGSFSSRRLREFRRLTAGRVPTSAGSWEVAVFRLSPSGRLARLVARRPVALQIPLRRHGITVLTPGLIRRAHAAGVHVHVWTVDDRREMIRLLDQGVDGLVTDRTDVLKDVLTSRGQWRTPR